MTLISTCVFGCVFCSKSHRFFDALRLDLRLVRALAQSGCISLVFHPQQLLIIFRLAVRASRGGLHLDFEGLQVHTVCYATQTPPKGAYLCRFR